MILHKQFSQTKRPCKICALKLSLRKIYKETLQDMHTIFGKNKVSISFLCFCFLLSVSSFIGASLDIL